MKQFIVKYSLEHGLTTSRIIKASTQQEAVDQSQATVDGKIQFETDKGLVYIMKEQDIKLISVHEYKSAAVLSRNAW